MQRIVKVILGLAVGAVFLSEALAADSVTIGESASFNWSALPIEVGRVQGIWQKYGFDDVKPVAFGGDAKLQQALTSGDVEFGLGGGPAIAFFAKGVPAKAIAVEAYAPRTLSIMTVNDSGIHDGADLKGKKIGISTAGSLSEWLAKRFAIAQGWGPNGITPVALGGLDSNLAALKTHGVDAILTATAVGLQLEEKNEGKNVVNCGDYVGDFIATTLMARDPVISDKVEMTQRFVNAFFDTVAFMKSNKEKTVEIAMKMFNSSKAVMERTYDIEMPNMSDDGHFDAKAMSVLKDSFVEMGTLTDKPQDAAILTTRFVPAKLAR